MEETVTLKLETYDQLMECKRKLMEFEDCWTDVLVAGTNEAICKVDKEKFERFIFENYCSSHPFCLRRNFDKIEFV